MPAPTKHEWNNVTIQGVWEPTTWVECSCGFVPLSPKDAERHSQKSISRRRRRARRKR